MLRSGQLQAAAVRQAREDLLQEDAYRGAAAQVAAQFPAYDPAERFRAFLQSDKTAACSLRNS
jgi:hypothetical protein